MSNISRDDSTSDISSNNNSIVQKVYVDCSTDDNRSLFENEMTESEDSSDGMEIVITDSPSKKKEIDIEDKLVIENIEEEIEKQLDEKAAKSNLTATNVKTILKQVISNEHVLAMVRHTVHEGDSTDEESFIYEPKLTRAKAKELLEQNVNLPWVKRPPKPASEVHLLINEEFPEDSDDDEYVPNEIESEDDKEKSDVDSQPATPQTPLLNDSSTQTNWTEDGVFKIPQLPEEDKKTEAENIALRTRSKLSLSDTPLEKIEETFIPPDITPDMYDFECDDENWQDFLKKFAKPLDEAVQGPQEDDDEADPEYNLLADEETKNVDTEELHEELREDRGVKVTKKELNALVQELSDFNDFLFMNTGELNIPNEPIIQETHLEQTQTQFEFIDTNITQEIKVENKLFGNEQIQLLEQQLRQHVQLLTSNFLQTYRHPKLSDFAPYFKNQLLGMYELGKYKERSAFHIANLQPAVDLISDWEKKFENGDSEVQSMIKYTRNVVQNSMKSDNYHISFAPQLMKFMVTSTVFLYPELLPKVPFKCNGTSNRSYLESEDQLIALGLEQFHEMAADDCHHRTKFGKMRLGDAAYYISKFIMPHRDADKIYNHIKSMNDKGAKPNNPIKYYFEYEKAPPYTHIVIPVNACKPPCMQPPEKLPLQWKNFIYPIEIEIPEQNPEPVVKLPITRLPAKKPPARKRQTKNKISASSEILQTVCSTSQPYILIPVVNGKITIPDINCNNTGNKRKRKNSESDQSSKFSKLNDSDYKENTADDRTSINDTEINHKLNKSDIREQSTLNYILSDNNLSINSNINSSTAHLSAVYQARLRELLNVTRFNSKQKLEITPELKKFKFNSDIFKKFKKQNIFFNSPIFKHLDRNMLPSMPFLLTPCKNPLRDEEPENFENERTVEKDKFEDTEKDKTVEVENQDVDLCEENEILGKKDNEDELNALMVASSTIQNKSRKLPPTSTEKRKLKLKREYNATLAMLSPEDPSIEEEKAKNYAEAYFDKVQERLGSESPCNYQKFMSVLNEYDESSPISDLFMKVESVLSPKHKDLCEEFLTFLTPEQAKQIGKLVPHFLMTNMSLFLRKLEIYFSNQPAQLKKIFNSLMELSNTPDIKMENVKSMILPLLKGNHLLIDWFLQMFPTEAPPESLMTDWETIQCDEENLDDDDNMFETIALPEVEDPYGGPNCICKCHNIDDEMYKSRNRHCIPCGTKFLQGRVYVQTGKGLRLANVTFNSNPNCDHNKRLSVKPTSRQKRKSETSPAKNPIMSPTKEDEPRHSNESEDDINIETLKIPKRTSKVTSSPRRQRRNRSTPKIKPRIKIKPIKDTPVSRRIVRNKIGKKILEEVKEKTVETEVSKTESENELTEDPKSPGHSIESMDTCEESSQDTIGAQNSDSDNDSIIEVESVSENSEESCPEENNDSENSAWTRQEDKIILQMFKEHGEGEGLYKKIQQNLSSRSIQEIKQRFKVLLSLLKEMSLDSSTS